MATYQGRALRTGAPRVRRGPLGKLGRILRVIGVLGVIAALAHVPWGTLRSQAIHIAEIRVEGLHYLDAKTIAARSGLKVGAGWLDADLNLARQRLLADSRIRAARVSRQFPAAIEIRIEERIPVLLVHHGGSWEMGADGVLMAPLKAGLVADVPPVDGIEADPFRAGTCIATPESRRALAWVDATADPQLELAGRISGFNVSNPASTALVLMDGTRVLAPAWPPGLSTLSSLRVVLASLGQRGISAQEIDLRYKHQVIVRPAAGDAGTEPS